MTRELLEDYPHILRRLERMEAVCADTVQGSSPEFPYIKRTVSIQGVRSVGAKDEQALAELRAKRRAVEDWVAGLPTERERTLVELHALRGLTWGKVFRQTGYHSPDAARVAYGRLLKKYL